MSGISLICYLVPAFGVMGVATGAETAVGGAGKSYPDPKRYEKDIAHFEAGDKATPPPSGAVLCIGSSSMRMWHATIREDLAPLTVIPRGFGGSNMNDVLYYADRVVLPYKPRAIVLYEGDNDVAHGVAPARIGETFRAFVDKVHARLPETRIYFLSIKPSVSRWKLWPVMVQANALIAEQCAKDKRLTYVDVAKGMFDDSGLPRKDIFKQDNLHMTRSGYEIWRDILRPVLLKTESPFESDGGR